MRPLRIKTRWSGLDAHRPQPWKEPTRCIFCGVAGMRTPEGKLTKEHIYSNWARRFVPRSMKNFRSLRATRHPDRTDFIIVRRSGDLRDWQVACVCAACNNGWMRQRLDEVARPVLIPLIKGEQTRLSPEHQLIVATWAAMKTMVAEYRGRECVTTHHTFSAEISGIM